MSSTRNRNEKKNKEEDLGSLCLHVCVYVCVCLYRRTEEAVNYCDRETERVCRVSPQVALTIAGDLHDGYDGRIWRAHQVERDDYALKSFVCVCHLYAHILCYCPLMLTCLCSTSL